MGQVFGQEGQCDQNDRADQRGDADQRMECKTDGEIKRQPWQIVQCARPHPGQEGADVVEITQRLKSLAAVADDKRHPDDDVIDPAAQHLVQCRSDPDQNAAADQVEDTLDDIEPACQHDQADQRGDTAARQHPVVDLKHEERAGEIQNVDDEAHHADTDKGTAAGAKRRTQLGPGRMGLM